MMSIVARPPVGTHPQAKSLAAVAAFLASRLIGVKTGKRDEWLAGEQLVIGRNGLERAGTYARSSLRHWLIVDEPALGLGLEKAAIVFPGSGRARPELIEALRRTKAVRQLLVMRSRRDVIAILVFPGTDKEALFAEIESAGEPFVWEELLEDDRLVEAEMWLALMHRAAEQESLVGASAPESP
jgi:hypothetical protein